VKEKKYLPAAGAVNLPDVKFMAPPTFSSSTSNGMGILISLSCAFLWA
jgi:hypothetical protein